MEEITTEYINALSPYDHGLWEGQSSDGGDLKVGDKSLFTNRAFWLVEKISSYLSSHFTEESLSQMSILEVASYDGWILTEICKRFNFKEVIGVEPRSKNILKGKVGRRLAKIDTKAEFIQGSISTLSDLFKDKQFDIVICLGMLHHVSSTYEVILELARYTSDLIILDSMIIPEINNDKNLIEPFVNTKDIIYSGEESKWSIAAFKYESPYSDGSCPDLGIVNIPSASLIHMSLKCSGFEKYEQLGDESDHFEVSKQSLIGVKETLLASRRSISKDKLNSDWQSKVKSDEDAFCHLSLPENLIFSLSSNILFKKDRLNDQLGGLNINKQDEALLKITDILLEKGLNPEVKEELLSIIPSLTNNQFKILSLLFRAPYEKTLVEVSKYFISINKTQNAVYCLEKIVKRQGCDWWSFYRSCYLLVKAYRSLGENAKSKIYLEYLILSNENFPFIETIKEK